MMGEMSHEGALQIADLMLQPRSWIHRRVEQIGYLDKSAIRRRISIDFTAPVVGHVPLTQLEKGKLTNFDLRDEQNLPIPMPTAIENSAISAAMLTALAHRAAPELVDSIVLRYIQVLVRADADRTRRLALDRIFQPRTTVGEALYRDDDFRTIARELADAFVLYVDVEEASVAQRRVVKLAFDASKPGPKPGTIGERVGWSPVLDSFSVPQAGTAQSIHFEIEAPRDMTVSDGVLVAWRSDNIVHDELTIPARRAHFNLSEIDRAEGGAFVSFRLSGGQLLGPAAAVAVVNAAALGFVTWQARSFGSGETDAVTAVLVVIPGVLLSAIIRNDEHEVLAGFLAGARGVAALSALVSFGAALALAAGFGIDTRRIVLLAATLVTAVCALILVRSWRSQR